MVGRVSILPREALEGLKDSLRKAGSGRFGDGCGADGWHWAMASERRGTGIPSAKTLAEEQVTKLD